ncbi:hypothetical protein VE00_00042 [Pseudogymnoascus sp. WSF 3629]|nr:hypothetical protein VE00_00042 [Pseudogymnoascus sp. WSF 3629]
MRPSKDESESWYYGIDARMDVRSLLIARSSTYPFQPFIEETRDDPDGSPRKRLKRKAIFTIGNHKITTIYDSDLRLRVREILSSITWKTIDVVRLGYKDEPSCPVILITVDINDVNEDSAQDAVYKIHELMIKFGLPDIHAEIKTGRLFEQTGYNQNVHYPLELLRVPKIGASIGNANSDSAGSICLFLKIDGSDYALTCQHVVTASSEPLTPRNDPDIILQPAKQDLRRYETDRDYCIEEEKWALEEFDAKKLRSNDEGVSPMLKEMGEEAKLSLNKLNRCIADKLKMQHVRLPFGILAHAPGISTHPLTNHKRDWALVKLDDERFQTLPPNILPPAHFTVTERSKIRKFYSRSLGFPGLLYNNVVTTTAILPLKELNRFHDGPRPLENQDYESLRVFKHGCTSGWTAGFLNEIRSDCCFGSGGQTMEYCVVNILDLNYFSYQDDSGACVLDIEGRIVGMLHSGNGENIPFGAEITYLTPVEWIIQDIRDTLKTEDVVIEKHIEKED